MADGELTCEVCPATYPVDKGIPRFVPEDNYAKGFGYQWNRHRLTQLDSHCGLPISRDRVMSASGWTAAELRGKSLLECGSGAGRFTEVLCETGAVVTSFDISSAVHANAASNGHFPNLLLLQASIYDLPLPEESFDYLFCFGVIQHTPDVERTFKTLFRYLRPGGRFCVDVYAAPISYLHPRQLLRPLTKRVPPARLYAMVEKTAPKLLPLSLALSSVPVAGPGLARLVPVAIHRHLGLRDRQTVRDWSVLDTFDWFAPRYERPQTRRRLERWTRDLGLKQVSIHRNRGLYVVRGVK
ncbi:class I SAM-dependent methyltransferase [Nonomuraea cavernae]|uniref:class I SAM-dependent methyltransferase n=1 Tax=Nonomuraea cavernae TaxID=2045107 RepID=UPI00166C9647|nr:class I SAM-dependent methyltransferase [Nonomuraea cavernae]MCA2185141.1 methyltransferase domain-containing protein [Nonomuraea cavernae]